MDQSRSTYGTTVSRQAFILGGTGQIGWAVAAELNQHGWNVTVSRTGAVPRQANLSSAARGS
jgi:NAD(P)-dependent dehydrogenase (short-subunit alcohol dehydrogenase family)